MIKSTKFVIGAAMLASIALPLAAFAQVPATMPVLYNQSGTAMNNGNTSAVPAGYYFLQPGVPSSQVYYYGNGTYYDPAKNEYGGSVTDPNGTAGVALGYNVSGTLASNTTVPGVPNTGAGGDSSSSWAILAISGVAVLIGAAYVSYALSRPKQA